MRPTREYALMETAFIWARRSTCDRLHVGCVLHRDGRILVQGYNGAPAGLKHCNHSCTCSNMMGGYKWQQGRHEHLAGCPAGDPCTRAVHAEQNAISFAARWGVELEGASASVTHQPCVSCAQSLINGGIRTVYYVEPYRLKAGVELLEEAGIMVVRMLDFPLPN